jgi:prepilin-type N-terminal cleavage/methylation domain-containing protein
MRRAFTLLEVIVAITIAGLIALAARATLVAGLDTQERLQLHNTRTEGSTRFRALVMQAMRHMTDAPAVAAPPFVLRDTVTDEGSGQVVEFFSRGLSSPAGTGAIAFVRLVPTARGLTISAARDGAVVLQGTDPNIAAARLRVQTQAGEWLETWPRSLQTPAAVIIDFVPRPTSTGVAAAVPPPLVVATQLETRP